MHWVRWCSHYKYLSFDDDNGLQLPNLVFNATAFHCGHVVVSQKTVLNFSQASGFKNQRLTETFCLKLWDCLLCDPTNFSNGGAHLN